MFSQEKTKRSQGHLHSISQQVDFANVFLVRVHLVNSISFDKKGKKTEQYDLSNCFHSWPSHLNSLLECVAATQTLGAMLSNNYRPWQHSLRDDFWNYNKKLKALKGYFSCYFHFVLCFFLYPLIFLQNGDHPSPIYIGTNITSVKSERTSLHWHLEKLVFSIYRNNPSIVLFCLVLGTSLSDPCI